MDKCVKMYVLILMTILPLLNGKASVAEEIIIDDKSKRLSKELVLDLKNTERLEGHEEGRVLVGIIFPRFSRRNIGSFNSCVFPMIPLTVSFFTKQSKNKAKGITNAILYGLFIVIIYILLSVPFHLIDGIDPNILNTISTNVWLNIFFFAILIFFAFSFFGYYEITLPNSWGNKVDSASNVGGIVGIFLMALTLAIISFSCRPYPRIVTCRIYHKSR